MQMLKNNPFTIFAGASALSLGTVWLIFRKKKQKDSLEYTNAIDEVLTQSGILRLKKEGSIKEQVERKLKKSKDKKMREKQIEDNSLFCNDEEGSQVFIKHCNLKQSHEDFRLHEEQKENEDLQKSREKFERVVNQRVRIKISKENKEPQETNEFSELISRELQKQAGDEMSACLKKLEKEIFVCVDCWIEQIDIAHNQSNGFEEEQNQNRDLENKEGSGSTPHMNVFFPPIELMEIYCYDCILRQHGSHTIYDVINKKVKQPLRKDNKANNNNSNHNNNNIINDDNDPDEINNKMIQIKKKKKDQMATSLVFSKRNKNDKRLQNIDMSSSYGDFNKVHQFQSHKQKKENQSELTKTQLKILSSIGLIQESYEILKQEREAISHMCSGSNQIQIGEESIPNDISNHLGQELNLIFDALFDRVQQTENEEMNYLLRVLLKRVDEIMMDNNILKYIIGKIFISKNILDRILTIEILDQKNQQRLAEILIKIGKIDYELRVEITSLLLQHFKTVFMSHFLTSTLASFLRQKNMRKDVLPKVNKASYFLSGLLNAKNILDKQNSSRYINKVMRCIIITRILCSDPIFVAEGIAKKAGENFCQAICGVAQIVESQQVQKIRVNLLKNLIQNDLSSKFFFLKELDFQLRLLFTYFIANTKSSQKYLRASISQNLNKYLLQNVHQAYNNAKKVRETENSLATQQQQNNQSQFIRLSITSLNMIIILEKTFQINARDSKFAEYSSFLLEDYLFNISEGYELLKIENIPHIFNNPNNKSMLERLLFMYGVKSIGDFHLLIYLQQSGEVEKQNLFIQNQFSKQNNTILCDLHQNLRFLFTDACNQTKQLLVNILQINKRQMLLSQLVRELLKYTSLHELSVLKEICEVVQVDLGTHIVTVSLKEEYFDSFFPLLFAKYPSQFDKLIQLQDIHFQNKKKSHEIIMNVGAHSIEAKDIQFISKDYHSQLSESSDHFNSSNFMFSSLTATSNLEPNNQNICKMKVITANNFEQQKENQNDIFGSDYDLTILKDRILSLHQRLTHSLVQGVKIFFDLVKTPRELIIEKTQNNNNEENKVVANKVILYESNLEIIQIYIRILIFLLEVKQCENKDINHTLSKELFTSLCTFPRINCYLLEDLRFLSQSS